MSAHRGQRSFAALKRRARSVMAWPFLKAGVIVEGRVRVVTAIWRKDPSAPESEQFGFLASPPFWHVDERPAEQRGKDVWIPNSMFDDVRTQKHADA